jgi:hypothetical protein
MFWLNQRDMSKLLLISNKAMDNGIQEAGEVVSYVRQQERRRAVVGR